MAAQPESIAKDANSPWLRTYFLNRLSMLDRERVGYWSTWKDLASQFAPRRGKFLTSANDTTRGRRKDQRIIDNTGLLSARVLASGMQAGISSPARPWFRLRLADRAANDEPGLREWLDLVAERMLDVFRRSNLYNCLHTLYGELGVFGVGALWVDEDEEDLVRGYVMTVGEYWLASSRRLAVDTVYRSMWWTVRQIVDMFGRDKVSAAIRANYDAGQLDVEYEIVHAIEPNPNAAPKLARIPRGSAFPWDGHLAQKFPFRSVWFERGAQGGEGNSLLRVSGYEEFPAMCPRWEVAGSDTYGSSAPGWVGLGDSQSLQVLQRRGHEVADKLSKPPMKGPPSLRNDPASLLPGGLTIVNEMQGSGKFEPAFEVKPEGLTAVDAKSLQAQERIKQAFFADLFLMISQLETVRTATEITERRNEKLIMLGPVLERLHDELLDPLVKRVFNIMARNGLIPPPPPGLEIATMQVEFISMLAQAQKAVATGTIERFWQFAAQAAAAGKPEALDRLDTDGTIDVYADLIGVPASVVVDLDKANAARKARAEKQAEADRLAIAEHLATVGKTASEIDVGGGANAVSAMLGRA